MCRIEVKTYVDADGQQRVFEDSYPCHNARPGEVCSSVTKKFTRVPSKAPIVTHDDIPTPLDSGPPTPISSGTYLRTNRADNTGRPPTRDGSIRVEKPKIIIEFGKKGSKKKYSGESSKGYKRKSLDPISIGSNDIAVESPGSEKSFNVHTGFPEDSTAPTDPLSYTTRQAIPRGQHRHTSSASSFTTSSQPPSLYAPSEPGSPPRRSPARYLRPSVHTLPPGIHLAKYPSPFTTSQASFDPLNPFLNNYSDLLGHSGSSHASSGKAPAAAPEITDRGVERARQRQTKIENDRRQQHQMERERAEAIHKDEEAKQVRSELARAEHRAKERAENSWAQSEKGRAEEREEARPQKIEEGKLRAERGAAGEARRKEIERKEEVKKTEDAAGTPAHTSSKRRSRRPSISHERIADRERALAETQAQMSRERAATERRERDEAAAILREQQKAAGYYDPRGPPQPYYISVKEGPGVSRRNSTTRRGSVSSSRSPIPFGQDRERRMLPYADVKSVESDRPAISPAPSTASRVFPMSKYRFDNSIDGMAQPETQSKTKPRSTSNISGELNFISGLEKPLDRTLGLMESSIPRDSETVSASPNISQSISKLGRPRKSSTEEEEEKETQKLSESDEESDDTSNGGDVSMKSALDTAMGVVKGLLLQELVDYALHEAKDAQESSSSGSTADSAGGSTSSSLASGASKVHGPPKGKRMRGGGRDPGDDDDDGSEEDDDRPKKKNGKDSPDRLPHRRLKCPFYQRQPEKYKKAACRGEGFADMAKLKDHIKRVHTQPLRCCRCWLEMESEDVYNEHLQQEEVCRKSPEPHDDRIPRQLLRHLDFKKAPYANTKNVEEKWTMLFTELFPDETTIPSPYERQGMSPQLERALSEALEEELTRELEPILGPIMSRIKALVPGIIERCHLKLTRETQPLDCEAESTPPVVSSMVRSEDANGKSTKNLEHRDATTKRHFTGRNLEPVSFTGISPSKILSKRPQNSAPSSSETSAEDPHEVSSPASSTDLNMVYPNAPGMPESCEKIINHSLGMEKGRFQVAVTGDSPGGESATGPEGQPTVFMDTIGMALNNCDFVEGLSQQSHAYLPSSPSWGWWNMTTELEGQPAGEQPDPTISQGQDVLPEWNTELENFDFSHFPSNS